ncbi:MAG TPA: hypothetical protein VML19_18085 [Verrucomicrobiae bacterium]|nr:hypothetical protein [Verrucomicrobiae bacterium]
MDDSTSWPLRLRIAFRFCCCYLLLYSLPSTGAVSIFQSFPSGEKIARPYVALWHAINPWVAIHVFHLSGQRVTYFPTGSGDTTLDYIQNLLYLLIAVAATLIWSVLDRRRPHYRELYPWLRLLVRYTLAFTLFAYGFAKLFPLQFQPARLHRLVEPYGEFSPMGVLWNFMGASQAFTIFSGAAETLGGVLMLFRRTTTLGSMAAFAVLANVVALNFCYDVPVKLYSTNLLLMSVFLMAPDFRRLLNVLVFNRPAAPAPDYAVRFERRWLRLSAAVFAVFFVGYQICGQLISGWQFYHQVYVSPQRPPLYGLYDVESGAPSNWRKVIFEAPTSMAVRTAADEVVTFPVKYAASSLRVNGADDYTWSAPDASHLVLTGKWAGDPSTIRLRRIDPSQFLLHSRGFHWISEQPFNK